MQKTIGADFTALWQDKDGGRHTMPEKFDDFNKCNDFLVNHLKDKMDVVRGASILVNIAFVLPTTLGGGVATKENQLNLFDGVIEAVKREFFVGGENGNE